MRRAPKKNIKGHAHLELAVVVPTFNERLNIGPFISLLESTLEGIGWEAIFVDDDSPDGTADVLRDIARERSDIRLLHRIGRRGLASATAWRG